MDSICVPFMIEQSFFKTTGQLRLEEECIHLEFQRTDAFFQYFKSKVEEHRIAIGEIEDAEYSSAWLGFSNVLRIKVRSMKTVENFPGCELACIKFEIERSARNVAAEFASQLRFRISELKLKQLEGQGPKELSAGPVNS